MVPHVTSSPESYDGHDLEALVDLPHYVGCIARNFSAHLRGRVLEVGAGTGNFTTSYVDAVDEAVLIEPARNLFPRLAARFVDRPHVQAVCGVLEECSENQLGDRPFDAAVMINVLEHIEDDLGTVRRLGSLLRPDGKLLIFVPALRWLYGSLDASVHHFRRYTRSSLARLMGRAGLETVALHYFDAAGVVPWFITGRVLRQRCFSARAARIYDRAVVPVMSRLERLIRLPMGKNLICVARRPRSFAAGAALRAA